MKCKYQSENELSSCPFIAFQNSRIVSWRPRGRRTTIGLYDTCQRGKSNSSLFYNLQNIGKGLVELGDLGRDAEVDGAVAHLQDEAADDVGVDLLHIH
jgi:hypothetical protein